MKLQEGAPKPIDPKELLESIGKNTFSETPNKEELVTDFDRGEKRKPIFTATKQVPETEPFVGGIEPIKKPSRKESEAEDREGSKKINNLPEDTTSKTEKLKAFAEEVKESNDPLALVGLKIKTEELKPKIPETKEQKLSFLDRLLAKLRKERAEKQKPILLEELRAGRLQREIQKAVAEGNALLDAQEKKLPERDRILAQSTLNKYRGQKKTKILTERRPEEEYAGITNGENSY